MTTVRTVGLLGTGVIGAGWAARLLNQGYDVIASDPGEGAEERLRAAIDRAQPALDKLTLVPLGQPGKLSFTTDMQAAAAAADFIQESAPDREDLKIELLTKASQAARPEVIIASSSSGLLPSRLQAGCAHPERVLIGHPFNPVYLLPLCEVVGGQQTSAEAIDRAMAFYRRIGMQALHVRKEIDGYLSDRLQEAVWREILHLINDDVANTDELDQAIIYGPGLRWAIMGTCLTFHLAGGQQGMRHMLHQFGPALKLPWTKLVAPELTEDLIDKMVSQTQSQAGERTIEQLERLRDDCLIGIMQCLKTFNHGAGETLKSFEKSTYQEAIAKRFLSDDDVTKPLDLLHSFVRSEWVDYNGHMTEARYLQVFGDANDAVMRYIGSDDAHQAEGYSYYTVETHIMHVKEVAVNAPLRVTTQLLSHDEKRLHIFHAMYHGDSGDLLATGEHMCLHVDTKAGKACAAPAPILAALKAVAEGHDRLPKPEQAGRHVGERR